MSCSAAAVEGVVGRAGGRVRVWDQLYESRISSGRGVTAAEHLATFHVCARRRAAEGTKEGGRADLRWMDGMADSSPDCLSCVRPSLLSLPARNEPLALPE